MVKRAQSKPKKKRISWQAKKKLGKRGKSPNGEKGDSHRGDITKQLGERRTDFGKHAERNGCLGKREKRRKATHLGAGKKTNEKTECARSDKLGGKMDPGK